MRVPFVDLHAEHMACYEEIDAGIDRVLSSCNFIGGEEVEAFEDELRQYLGVARVVSGANATQMLTITLKAFGIGKGNVVATTPLTAWPTVEAILATGADVSFVDPRKPKLFEADFKIDAFVPVHLYGIPAINRSDVALLQCRGVIVVEDCAQALGAEIGGEKVGTFGDASVYSFFPTKPLGCFGDGGAMSTNREDIYNTVKIMCNHGRVSKNTHVMVGENCRLDALQAAVLRAKLPHLDERNEMRRMVAEWYTEELQGSTVRFYTTKDFACNIDKRDSVWHIYPVFLPRGISRVAVRKTLASNGIETAIHYPTPQHLQLYFKSKYAKECAETIDFFNTELSLPMFPTMTREQVKYVCESLKHAIE